MNKLKKIIPKAIKRYYLKNLKSYKKISYSQCGEDLIMLPLIKSLDKKQNAYIDVGAHHPFRFSNTALFYRLGWHGINIEPDKNNFALFKKRKRDTNLNIGVHAKNGTMTYYHLNESTLNTFSKEEALDYEKKGFRIENTEEVPIIPLQEIIEKHNNGLFPPFLNIDTEGTEMEILSTIDYNNNYPKIICAETMSYGGFKDKNKNQELIDLLLNNGYIIYGQSSLNSIFVNKQWIGY